MYIFSLKSHIDNVMYYSINSFHREAEPNSEVDVVDEADGEAADDADDNDANEDDIRDDLSLYADDDGMCLIT